MPARVLRGKALAEAIEAEVGEAARRLAAQTGVAPCLAAVLVGDDAASATYVRRKGEACARVGFRSETFHLPEQTSSAELKALIDDLNRRPDVHGILVQLPLPGHLPAHEILGHVAPAKDVDGIGPASLGYLAMGQPRMVAATPRGIMALLRDAGLTLAGQEAVVIGRSLDVGRPMALLLVQEHATVTICHSRTKDLAFHTRRADLLVVAAGRARLITGDMVKPGAVVVDVGFNRVDGRLVGDVAFDDVVDVAGAITPVPGGVGLLTISMLLQNTLEAARLQITSAAAPGGTR